MIEIVHKVDEKNKRHIRFFEKDALISLARSFAFTLPWSSYERDIMCYIIDYMECSIDNRDMDEYDEYDYEKDGDNEGMAELHLIVKVGDKKQYAKINESNETITFVDDINDCSLFNSDYNETLSYYIHKVREQFDGEKFVASNISAMVLNDPLKNLIKVEKRCLD